MPFYNAVLVSMGTLLDSKPKPHQGHTITLGGVPGPGGVCSGGRGVCSGGCLLPGRRVPGQVLPRCGQTHECKHITLPQTSFAGGKNWSVLIMGLIFFDQMALKHEKSHNRYLCCISVHQNKYINTSINQRLCTEIETAFHPNLSVSNLSINSKQGLWTNMAIVR